MTVYSSTLSTPVCLICQKLLYYLCTCNISFFFSFEYVFVLHIHTIIIRLSKTAGPPHDTGIIVVRPILNKLSIEQKWIRK